MIWDFHQFFSHQISLWWITSSTFSTNNYGVPVCIRSWAEIRHSAPLETYSLLRGTSKNKWTNKNWSMRSDTTERLHFHFSLSCVGEGNGNPPQCSCLENPGDGGAWWAAVCRVAQSQTRLKRLSSSSSREKKIRFFLQRWSGKVLLKR